MYIFNLKHKREQISTMQIVLLVESLLCSLTLRIPQEIKLNCSSKQFSEKEIRGIKNLQFTYFNGS